MTCLRYANLLLIASCLIVTASGPGLSPAAPADAEEKYGYDDTPMLPGSPWRVHDRNRPQPEMITPGQAPGEPPSDAIVLFDGKDLSQWEGAGGEAIEDGAINVLKTKGLATKRAFGDCQLHLEWATPEKADGSPMNWGNSGIFFQGQYELQIIESHDIRIYADGIAGAIYGQFPPLVNPTRKPGQWQSFDVVFTAPRLEGEKVVAPARMTVLWNGVLVQYHQEVLGSTLHKTFPTYRSPAATGPLVIQQHNSAVRLRNIWIRPLDLK